MQPQPQATTRERAREFIRRNSPLGHFFLTLGLLYIGFLILKAFDPRIGVEGFGDLFGYGMNVAGLALTMYTCWWFKNHTWRDLSKVEEDALYEAAIKGDRHALWTIIRDRLEWVFLMVFFGYWIFH